MKDLTSGFRLVLLGTAILTLLPRIAGAHCDTLDGPVVAAARVALEKGDPTPVLRWVKQEHESEIRSAFALARAVRGKGPEAQELADMFFFETLVRVHRAGEGAPYTGLKPAGTDLGPAVEGADKSLDSGSVDELVKLVTGDVEAGIRERFTRAAAARKHADESVEAGREYVEAYVEYVHYAERVHAAAVGGALHGEPEAAAPEHHAH
jgi:hypothetical protein